MSVKFGVYEWTYSSGKFIVALRPNGTFYCEKYSAQATWTVTDSKLYVDWKNYGQYDFTLTAAVDTIDGHVHGDASKWRKMTFLRDFNETESAILGAGFGTVWDFAWEKGSFEIEFRVDGFNHFICKTYPAHSHWSLSEDQTVSINWGQFGAFLTHFLSVLVVYINFIWFPFQASMR